MTGVVTTLLKADTDTSGAGGATIMGLQEVLDGQLTDLIDGLGNTNWDHVGVGRDDGDKKGEYAPILFRKDVWDVVEGKTRWLSETPDTVGSKSWNTGSTRIMTYAVLTHKASAKKIIHANCHLDNAVADARAKQMGVVIGTLGQLLSFSSHTC